MKQQAKELGKVEGGDNKAAAKNTEEGYYDESGMKIKPATPLMKKVAEAVTDKEKMQQVFTPKEIREILDKKRRKEAVTEDESVALSKATRNIKRWAKARSTGDYGRIFLYPSYTSTDGKVWYKMIDFSALYFVYFLSERMGMNVNIYADTDRYAKSDYAASVTDIKKVTSEFMRLGGKKVEVAANGVYILTLDYPFTEEDYARMLTQEREKRDKMHNILKPTAMAPATHHMYVDLLRVFGPKIEHLDKRKFFSLGESMTHTLEEILKTYYLYSDGIYSMEKTGLCLIGFLDKLRADLFILQELDAWKNLATAAMMGEILIRFRAQVLRDFKIKVEKKEV